MHKLSKAVLLTIALVIGLNAAPRYTVLYNEWFTITAGNYLFKIIKLDRPVDATSNSFYLVGEAHAKMYDFNAYLLDADNFEVLTSGDNPQQAYMWLTKVGYARLIVGTETEFAPLEFGKKYYLVIDNRYSALTDKEVRCFLLAFWE